MALGLSSGEHVITMIRRAGKFTEPLLCSYEQRSDEPCVCATHTDRTLCRNDLTLWNIYLLYIYSVGHECPDDKRINTPRYIQQQKTDRKFMKKIRKCS